MLGFKPRGGSHTEERITGFGRERGENPVALKGEKHMDLAEWRPHGIVDGAGSMNHGLLLLFLRYGTPDWAEGGGSTVCISGYSKGL